MIVIDSSIALQWVLPEEGSERALRYVQAGSLMAPDILLVETANVLAKKVRGMDMSGEAALQALGLVKAAITHRVQSEPLVRRALQLSITLSHPVYDCVFLACAEQFDGKLATRDRPFIKRMAENGFDHLLEVSG